MIDRMTDVREHFFKNVYDIECFCVDISSSVRLIASEKANLILLMSSDLHL